MAGLKLVLAVLIEGSRTLPTPDHAQDSFPKQGLDVGSQPTQHGFTSLFLPVKPAHPSLSVALQPLEHRSGYLQQAQRCLSFPRRT